MIFRTVSQEKEAVQFNGENFDELMQWALGSVLQYGRDLKCRTNQGLVNVNPGDWVIKQPDGEFYPCSARAFAESYEHVPEPELELDAPAPLNGTAPQNEYMARFFDFTHLPDELQFVSRPFAEIALFVCSELPRNPERTVALRKLLEAKDCAVRARLMKD